jgi:hypothetical protein
MSAQLHSYDGDIIAWANEQARLLREGQFSQLDIKHIADGIEDVGKANSGSWQTAWSNCYPTLKCQSQANRQGQ